MEILPFIQVHHLQNYIYLVIFFGMFTDAAVMVFATVFLITAKVIGIVPGVTVLLLGIYFEQLFFYWLGLKLSAREKFSLWVDKVAKPFDRHLKSRPLHTLLISKFVYGLHRAMLVRSGMLKLPLKKFAEYAVYCSIAWLGVVGSLGAVFAGSYVELKKYFRYAEIVPLVLVAIFFLAEWLLAKKLKKEI